MVANTVEGVVIHGPEKHPARVFNGGGPGDRWPEHGQADQYRGARHKWSRPVLDLDAMRTDMVPDRWL
jgi:hypothetical protein